jgi:RNA polymerase sigma-70 factor (ECF subfamily)
MGVDAEIGPLVERARVGDELAASQIHTRFVERLIMLASRQFDLWSLRRPDGTPEDVVQSVFRTFFRRLEKGEFRLEEWEALWALLSLITRRKCRARLQYRRAGRRRHRCEPEQDEWMVPDRQPTPTEAAVLTETLSAWLAGLEPSERAIVEHGLQGYASTEIAARLRRSERSVRRARQRAEATLRAMLDTE